MEAIAAISTALGNGGIGIVRMSGKDTFKVLEKIFVPKTKQKIEDIQGYTIKYGYIINYENNEKIDEVLVSFFKAPKSYTTEDICEINSHGGMIIVQNILEQCLAAGASMAEPGEFTKKAFLNGRIDLSQAEGIIDLINSKTQQEAKASFQQLEGGLSKRVQEIRKQILNVIADIEASIDYPEYDIEELSNQKAKKELGQIESKLEQLENSFCTGKILKEGIRTVIIGKPNSGKSSLLNAILKEERAIVSSIKGTTRDTIEEIVNLYGVPLKLIDTAGIRSSEDEIEKIGVEKALKLVEEADLIISIFDNTKPLEEEDKKVLELISNKKAIILLNKIDEKDIELEKTVEIQSLEKPIIKISAKNKQGLEKLYEQILEMFALKEIEIKDGNFITNIRHKELIKKAKEAIIKGKSAIDENMPIDFIAISLKEALEKLSEITGENVSEDIIKEIFSKFCLGK
ncbi:MAG: tRNA uridine-5-carboxymethylaminomethyl(34) synthesis GTPase MnmE [Clostridia bacterium]|nr:tRNA uridine-5-carboxymethylaminomethyl(34) synthesis GTPase MnmE [Clostridia bacterium]